MTRLPSPVPGSASAPLREGVVVFEPRAAVVHVLNATASVVWAACCDGTDRDALLDELVEATSLERAGMAAQVDGCIAELLAQGLLASRAGGGAARPTIPWVEAEPPGAGPHRVRLGVLDEVIELCATDPSVIEVARAGCAELVTDGDPTLWLAVHHEADGRVRLEGPRAGARFHDDLPAFHGAMVSELNVATVRWRGGLALHAGGVRHPDGTVVGLLGESGAGKSTLVAALVQAGWDYLTDEALGVRPGLGVLAYPKPLSLDATSLDLLGLLGLAAAPGDLPVATIRPGAALSGEVGPVDALLVLDRHGERQGAHELQEVDGAEALTTVAPYSLNLHAAGSTGLAALAALADGVPCRRLASADLDRAVDLLDEVVHQAK